MRSTVLLFALLTVSLSPATFAQERTLSGTWLLKAEAARGQTENGGDWTRSAISGTLDVEQKGATLEGSWKGPVALWHFTGRRQGDTFEFRTEVRDMPVTRDGQQTTEAMRWSFRGSLAGEKLAGTMALHRADDQPTTYQPFTAERRR